MNAPSPSLDAYSGPLPPEFVSDALYGLDGLLIDEILTVDHAQNLVRVRMPVHEGLPITSTQKVHPDRHPRHVSGGLMVHMTGVVAFVHFYFIMGLRHSEGWTGYGVRMHEARFHALADMSAPLVLECRSTDRPRVRSKFLQRYEFKFTQNDKLVYEGDQTAIWMKV